MKNHSQFIHMKRLVVITCISNCKMQPMKEMLKFCKIVEKPTNCKLQIIASYI